MTSIVTTHYRYKRPPRKRKPVALDMPAIVAAKSSRRPNLEEKAAAEVPRAPVSREEGAAAQPSTPIVTTKSSRRPVWGETAAEVRAAPLLPRRGQCSQAHRVRQNESPRRRPTTTASRRWTKPAIVTTGRKHRAQDALPMELPLSRKPVERDGDEYKRMKAAMARRLRSE